MAIQMRRGNDANFQAGKMVAGEFAVSVDAKKVYICFSSNNVKEIALKDDVNASAIKSASISNNVMSFKNSSGTTLFTVTLPSGSSSSVTVDTSLSTSSNNPVQNKVVTQAINSKYTKPTTGIPASDLSSDVQEKLNNAGSGTGTEGSVVVRELFGSDMDSSYTGISVNGTEFKVYTDKALNNTSTNPVQNKVVAESLSALEKRVDTLINGGDGSVNQIPISTDASGNIFNDTGYKTGVRLNSSGTESTQAGEWVTGFIPAYKDDVFYLQGVCDDVTTSYGLAIGLYKADHSVIASYQVKQAYNGSPNAYFTPTFEGTAFVSVKIENRSGLNELAYVRFTGNTSNPAKANIARNEEIKEGSSIADIVGDIYDTDVLMTGELEGYTLKETIEQIVENIATDDEFGVVGKYKEQLDKAEQLGYKSCDYLGTKEMLNFLHISDTHGSVNMENAVDILNHLSSNGNCQFMAHTGDFHSVDAASSITSFTDAMAKANAPVMLVSGNHDVGNNATSAPNACTDAQLYTKVFAPYIDGWGLTNHPTGKNYYYKDFSDSKVRFIGLYDFESSWSGSGTTDKRGYCAYSQEQIDWLINALLTCPADYGVVIAKHNPVNLRGDLDNPFNSEYLIGKNTAQSYVDKNIIADIVQAFMDGTTINKTYQQTANIVTTLTVNTNFGNKNAGAEFVCYLNGHTHADGVSFLKDYPKQLELNVGCNNTHYQHYSDTLNEANTLHQDLLNYVSIDRNRGYVYIQRIGNDFSAHADRRDFTSIDYRNPITGNSEGSTTIIKVNEEWEKVLDYTYEETLSTITTGELPLLSKPCKKVRARYVAPANTENTSNVSINARCYTDAGKNIICGYNQFCSPSNVVGFIEVEVIDSVIYSRTIVGRVAKSNGYMNIAPDTTVLDGSGSKSILRIGLWPESTRKIPAGATLEVWGIPYEG